MVEARSLSVAAITQGVRALGGVKGRIAEMGNGSERFLLGWRRISAGLSQNFVERYHWREVPGLFPG